MLVTTASSMTFDKLKWNSSMFSKIAQNIAIKTVLLYIVLSSQSNPLDGIYRHYTEQKPVIAACLWTRYDKYSFQWNFNPIWMVNLVFLVNILFHSAFIRIFGFHVIQLINALFLNNTQLDFTQGTSFQIENATFANSPSTKIPLASVTL